MKANRKFIEADDHAVSAVIGVILMVAIMVVIIVAMAVTVYNIVSNAIRTNDKVLCGKISELPAKDGAGILKMDNQMFIIEDTGDTEYMLMQYAFIHSCNCTLVLTDSSYNNIFWVKGGSVSLLDCGCDTK